MTTTKSYDYLNRLTSTQSSMGVSPVSSSFYCYNTANQRTSVTNADSSYWIYQYDSLGQVKSGTKYWSDGTLVAGQQFQYTFDTIGNRTQTQSGGDSTGSNLRLANYTNNALNQIIGRDVPGYVDIQGSAITNAMVTVNGQIAYRKGAYFREEIATNSGSGSVWVGITNVATLGNGTSLPYSRTNSGNIFVAQTPEQFGYDADGNLTNDGRFAYAWDAENRLTNITSRAATPNASKLKLDMIYDYLGRRVQKIVSTNNGEVYIAQCTNKCIYDSWDLIVELGPTNNPLRSYVWGMDTSGGGDELIEFSCYGISKTNSFVAYDGNENVVELLNANDGTIMGQYEYGPFGEVLRSVGQLAVINPLRFATKYHDETDLLYYGLRYFSASDGRWLSRDPASERGGQNLNSVEGNDFLNGIDPLGLALLTHGASEDAVINRGILTDGLKSGAETQSGGQRPNIWMSDETAFVPENEVYLTYDINVDSAKEVPCDVIRAAKSQAKLVAETSEDFGTVYGNGIWTYINNWIQNQGGGIWKVATDARGRVVTDKAFMTGYQYAFSSADVWKSANPVLTRMTGMRAPEAFASLGENAKLASIEQTSRIKLGASACRALKVGGRILIVAGIAGSIYDIYTAEDWKREAAGQGGGLAGAELGWESGSLGGMAIGAAIPVADLTGVPEAIGYFVGGGLGAIGGFFIGHGAATSAYDVIVLIPGFKQ